MKTESKLLVELWEIVRDQLPAARRADTAFSMVQVFEDLGYDSRDLADIVDEDPMLARAFHSVFEGEEADEDTGYDEDE